MDALSETLRVVRLVGAIFIHGRFTAPWCYQSPHADAAAPFLEPGAERVVIFHLITEGECWVELDDQPPLRLAAGDAVLFPQGDAHRMGSQPGLPPAVGRAAARGAVAPAAAAGLRRRRRDDASWSAATWPATRAWRACCWPGCRRWCRVSVRGSNAGVWLEASVRYALAEARSPRPGGAGVLAKLAEVLFIEVLRLYMNEQAEGRTGWLAGVERPHRRRRAERAARRARRRPGRWRSWRAPPAPRARCWPSASSSWSAARRCST